MDETKQLKIVPIGTKIIFGGREFTIRNWLADENKEIVGYFGVTKDTPSIFTGLSLDDKFMISEER